MARKRPSAAVEDVNPKKQKLIDLELLGSDLTVLEKFVQLLETGELDDDYIEDALSNPNILSILTYLDSGSARKASELTTVLKALYTLILIGSRIKRTEIISVVHGLAEGVLEDLRFTSCIRALNRNQGAETNKAALRLLAVIVTVSTSLARGLLRSVPFSGQEFTQCSRRRNTADEQDVRSCFLNLVAAFVFSENDLVIREAIEKRTLFTLAINESYIDKYSNIMLILEMLIKITENKTISKTQKVRLFDRNSLKQLLYLYAWRGEALTLRDLTGRDEDSVDTEQLECIRKRLHHLLLLLTTSSRLGLVFSGRNRDWQSPANDLIFHALISPPMCPAYTDPLRFELVVSALSACPDILAPYLDHNAPLLYPRADSMNWFRLMSLVSAIYDRCRAHVVQWAVMAVQRSTTPRQAAQVILDCTFLSPKMLEPLSAALQFKESTKVVTTSVELMTKLRLNLVILLTWLSTSADQFPSAAYKPRLLKKELRQLLRERTPITEQFNALFDEKFEDPSVLHDQTFFLQDATDQPDAEPEEEQEPRKPVRTAEDDLTQLGQLPKKLGKTMNALYKSMVGLEVSDEKLHKAMTKLPKLLEECIKQHFLTGLVLRCITQAIRLRQSEAFADCPLRPKRILKLLLAHPQFCSVLHPDWLQAQPPAQLNQSNSTEANQDESGSRLYIRDCLIELLLALVRQSPKLGVKNLYPLWFLAAYSATTTIRDRNILELIFLMESRSPGLLTGARNTTPVPLVWGTTVGRHYRFPENKPGASLVQPVLFHQPNLGALFNCIDADQLRASSTHFPLTRKWLTQSPNSLVAQPVHFDSDAPQPLYDPCFLLHVFHHYLKLYRAAYCNVADGTGPAQTDQFLRTFYAHHCLEYTVGALSSYSKHLRSMARTVIADYRDLAEQWKPPRGIKAADGQANLSLQLFPERSKIMFILDTLRNSLSTGGGALLGGGSRRNTMFCSKADTGGRLTRIHANFFIQALQLISKPEHIMYRSLWNCLLSKPALDMNQVPDFLRSFFSTDTHFRAERHWISRLCATSLADGADYLVLERSRVFKHMLTAYSSPSSDATFQAIVLELLRSATSQPRLVHALIRFHALPLWLWRHALRPCTPAQAELFRTILDNIVNALSFKEATDSPVRELMLLLQSEFQRVQSQEVKPINHLSVVNGM